MHLGSTAVYLPGSAMHLGSAKSFSAPNNESNAQKSAKILWMKFRVPDSKLQNSNLIVVNHTYLKVATITYPKTSM